MLELADRFVATILTVWPAFYLLLLALVWLLAFALLIMSRQQGLELLRELARASVEPFVVWSVFLVHALCALDAETMPLRFVLPWPVATVVAGLGLFDAIRRLRQRQISKPGAVRYVLYCAAFWMAYALPMDPVPALGFSLFPLILARAIYHWFD